MLVGALSIALLILGVQIQHAVLGSLVWLALGTVGSWILEFITGDRNQRLRMLVLLGPGPLLALGVVVGVYLLVQGGWQGRLLVAAILVLGFVRWFGRSTAAGHGGQLPILLVVLIGCATLANSKEFPNLLPVGVSVVLAVLVWSNSRRQSLRIAAIALVCVVVAHDMLTRPAYWWWSSDDTTTLAGIGTIIIERGRVADVAGWSTSEHHWLLHAWLALWNEYSFGRVLETYLIAWPLVAAVSMFASLWIVIELFTGSELRTRDFAVVAVIVAGLVRLEWPAPQEQQPFLFAMVACSAMYLARRGQSEPLRPLQQLLSVAFMFCGIPAMLFVLKPSLLVAYGLLFVGTMLVKLKLTNGNGLVGAFALSVATVAAGISLMRIGGSWISDRSFTSFSIDWFPEDLGWCRNSSVPGSLACVVSLQAPLFVAGLFAVTVLWVYRRNLKLAISGVMMMPMFVAYLPLRYFVSSGVGSGAPSFYRLPEMALMLFIAMVIGLVVTKATVPISGLALAIGLTLVAVIVSVGPSRVYDAVDALLVKTSPLRFLSASDAIALLLLLVAAVVVVKYSSRLFGSAPLGYVVACLVFVSVLPVARMTYASATSDIDTVRLSRPADFGPVDIEQIGDWLQKHTSKDSLLATNFLCPPNRLEECTDSTTAISCAKEQPALMASWALAALSRRDFFYLSQSWHYRPLHYFMHQLSTRLGSEVSVQSIRNLQDEGVSYFVASREHSNPQAWTLLRAKTVFATEHFAVISLEELKKFIAA